MSDLDALKTTDTLVTHASTDLHVLHREGLRVARYKSLNLSSFLFPLYIFYRGDKTQMNFS